MVLFGVPGGVALTAAIYGRVILFAQFGWKFPLYAGSAVVSASAVSMIFICYPHLHSFFQLIHFVGR